MILFYRLLSCLAAKAKLFFLVGVKFTVELRFKDMKKEKKLMDGAEHLFEYVLMTKSD